MNAARPQTDEDLEALERAKARIGTVLKDKWTLDELIGTGGMASVYAATHRNQKRVAVKMLHPELCNDKEVRARFLKEGYAANIVAHEGAVSVLDDDVAPDGSAFLVMELLEGETVEQRWVRKGRRLPLREVLAITERLLEVLEAAHAKSIVHRDIKPENVFLSRAGGLKVLDFGIAKVFEAKTSKANTRAGMVMGTPAFMAPEQARARWDEVDARTDLWAVGAMMFTLLSGQHVHEAETGNEQLIYSATTPAQSIGKVISGIPRSVVATIDRALAFDKEQRWPDASAMREAVKGALDVLDTGSAMQSPMSIPNPTPVISAPATPTKSGTVATSGARNEASWAQERDEHLAEVAKLEPKITGIQGRLKEAQKKTAEVADKVKKAKEERASLEGWFKRQVGTRAVAVEEARKDARGKLEELGKRVLADRARFGAELDATRADVQKLTKAAAARARDVTVHEAALSAYNEASWKTGVRIFIGLAILVLLLFVVPVIWRLTAHTDPPKLPAFTAPAATS